MGTAWVLLLIAFPAEFRVHAQALYNFLEDSSKVDQFTTVQHCRDQDHKTVLAGVKAQILNVCTDHDLFQKAFVFCSTLPLVSYLVSFQIL